MSEWQPIITAPRGEWLIFGWWENGFWEVDMGVWAGSDKDSIPTHWMPLPQPPKEDGDE
jgi:hypothetical protein